MAASQSSAPPSWTIGRLLEWTARHLQQQGVEFPRLDAEVLLAHALECRRIELYTRYEEIADADARSRYRQLIQQRLAGCPVAYLTGRKEFFSLTFEVNPDVLIPRPDTELLVVECLRLARDLPSPVVLDIGTGSGNIAVSVAKRHPGAQVTAIDQSAEALAVAARNAERHSVGRRIRFLQGDLFAPLPKGEPFDFILSNPPYIASEDLGKLPAGVRSYEPQVALDGGPGGFAVFSRIVAEAGIYLRRGGHLLLEIGVPQQETALKILSSNTAYDHVETLYDGSRHPRVLKCRRGQQKV